MCYCKCHDECAGRYASGWRSCLCWPVNVVTGIPWCIYSFVCCPVLCGICCYQGYIKSDKPDEINENITAEMLTYCPCAAMYHISCWTQPWSQDTTTYKVVTGRTPCMMEE